MSSAPVQNKILPFNILVSVDNMQSFTSVIYPLSDIKMMINNDAAIEISQRSLSLLRGWEVSMSVLLE